MAAIAGDLPVVALFRGDVAEARSGARDIDDDAGQFGSSKIADGFRHEADAWAGRGGHGSLARRGRAIDHVDGGDFTFSLQELPAATREVPRRGFQNLSGGRNRVAIERAAPGQQRPFHHRFVSL